MSTQKLYFSIRGISPQNEWKTLSNSFFFPFSIIAEIDNEQPDLIIFLHNNSKKCYLMLLLTWKHNLLKNEYDKSHKDSKMETQHNVKAIQIKIIYSQYGFKIAILFQSNDKLRNKSILCFPILLCQGLKALYSCKLSSVIDGGGRKSAVFTWRNKIMEGTI